MYFLLIVEHFVSCQPLSTLDCNMFICCLFSVSEKEFYLILEKMQRFMVNDRISYFTKMKLSSKGACLGEPK